MSMFTALKWWFCVDEFKAWLKESFVSQPMPPPPPTWQENFRKYLDALEPVRAHADVFTVGRVFNCEGVRYQVVRYAPGSKPIGKPASPYCNLEHVELEYADAIGVIHRIAYEGEQLPHLAKRLGAP